MALRIRRDFLCNATNQCANHAHAHLSAGEYKADPFSWSKYAKKDGAAPSNHH